MNTQRRRSFLSVSAPGRLCILVVGTIGVFAIPKWALAQEACLNDVALFNNAVCTANDVRISQINVLDGPTECIEGLPVTIENLEAELLGGSKERYDIGIYLATDGGDAKASLSGDNNGCIRNILTPLGSGMGEFDDLEGGGDFCGDIRQGVKEKKPLEDVTLQCEDTDDDGFLDVGTCLSWDNNKQDLCETEDDAFPGTPSKCRCEPIQVGEITVVPRGRIIVEKKVSNIQNDATEFTFEGDAAGSITEQQTISVGGLEPGMYSSTEILPSLYILTDITCDDENSFGSIETQTATFIIDDPEEVVTCTFTNKIFGG